MFRLVAAAVGLVLAAAGCEDRDVMLFGQAAPLSDSDAAVSATSPSMTSKASLTGRPSASPSAWPSISALAAASTTAAPSAMLSATAPSASNQSPTPSLEPMEHPPQSADSTMPPPAPILCTESHTPEVDGGVPDFGECPPFLPYCFLLTGQCLSSEPVMCMPQLEAEDGGIPQCPEVKPYCSVFSGYCVECLVDDDCQERGHNCSAGECRPGCRNSHECQPNMRCEGYDDQNDTLGHCEPCEYGMNCF